MRAYGEIEEMKTASIDDVIQKFGWEGEEMKSWGLLDDGCGIGKSHGHD